MLLKVLIGILAFTNLVLLYTITFHFVNPDERQVLGVVKAMAKVDIKRVEELLRVDIPMSEIEKIKVVKGEILSVNDNLILKVKVENKDEEIKLLGVKAPNNFSKNYYKNCFDKNWEDEIENELIGKTILLVADNTIENGQYAYFFDSKLLNISLIEEGIAVLDEENISGALYERELNEAYRIAQIKNKGIWSEECIEKVVTQSKKENFAKNVLGSGTIPTPTKVEESVIESKPVSSPSNNSLNSDLVFTLINNHRTGKGLPAFEKDAKLCEIAESRKPELRNEIFGTGTVHEGFYARNIPFWITENMAGYGSEEANVKWWLGSTVHRNAIEGDYKYSCGACDGKSCVQLFTNWTPK